MINWKETERLDGDQWTPAVFEQLRPGDHFRCWHTNERGDRYGMFEGICKSEPEPCMPEGNWQFTAERVLEMHSSAV